MKCPVCGRTIRPNKGWAAQFYDGYCNHCDMPVEDGIPDDEGDEDCEQEEVEERAAYNLP